MIDHPAALSREARESGEAPGLTGRFVFRVLVLSASTALAYAALLVAALLARLGLADLCRWRAAVFRRWARGAARTLGMRLEVIGEPPPSPCFLVSNHLSYVDVIALATVVPASFVAKSEVRRWPVVGEICRAAGTLFVDRASRRDVLRVNRQVAAALERGANVILFPEGTSTRGAEVAPFRAPLLAPAADGDLPLYCASLTYSTAVGLPPAQQAVCWWGEMEFGPHVRGLLRLPGFRATLRFSQTPMRHRDRKVLADGLHRAVCDLFVPVGTAETVGRGCPVAAQAETGR